MKHLHRSYHRRRELLTLFNFHFMLISVAKICFVFSLFLSLFLPLTQTDSRLSASLPQGKLWQGQCRISLQIFLAFIFPKLKILGAICRGKRRKDFPICAESRLCKGQSSTYFLPQASKKSLPDWEEVREGKRKQERVSEQ